MHTQHILRSLAHRTHEQGHDSVYDDKRILAKLINDIIDAIWYMDATGEYPDAVMAARKIIMKDEGVLILVEALSELYAEADMACSVLPKQAIHPRRLMQKIARAIEETSAYYRAKKITS